jgi:hypothetical protein
MVLGSNLSSLPMTWVSYLFSLSLSFLICKTGIVELFRVLHEMMNIKSL